jgi:capsular polysaccharide biosynthesis protein
MEKYHTEDGITLKELLVILLNGWKTVAIMAVLGFVLAVVYSYFIVKPVYETEIELFMIIPKEVTTEVGAYRYPSDKTRDYFDLISNSKIVNHTIDEHELEMTQQGFVSALSISQDKESNVILVTFKGHNPDLIAKVLDDHVTNYKHYLSYQFREDAVNQFVVEKNVSLSVKEDLLAKLEDQLVNAKGKLSGLSPTIPLQKALTTNPEFAAKYARDNGLTVAELSNQLLVEEVVSTNYTEVKNLVDNLETSIGTLKFDIVAVKEELNLLESEKMILKNTEVFQEPKSDFLKVLSLPIKQMAPANIPVNSISPRRQLNINIGVVLFSMLGVFIVFFREYWRSN